MKQYKNADGTRAKNVYVNSAITLIGQIVQILLGFIVRRLFIRYLGNSYLGYDSVFSNILQMLNIADLESAWLSPVLCMCHLQKRAGSN